MARPVSVLDAPSNLGLRPPAPGREPGVRRLPDALRREGLLTRLPARDAGRVEAPPYSTEWRRGENRNGDAIASYSITLADTVEPLLREERFPLVVGGDCSIILGTMLALRRLGRYGLAFFDGHLDFRHPGHGDEVGEVADEDLALLTGRGPDLLADLEGRRPLLLEEDVVAIGYRPYEGELYGVADANITLIDAVSVRSRGVQRVGEQALEVLTRPELEGFWIHVDADVLDASLMPAVDTPETDGLTIEELVALLSRLVSSGRAVGMQVTILDPDLDPDGRYARSFVDIVAEALRR